MKKIMRILLSAAAAAVLVMLMSVTVFAEIDNYNIKLTTTKDKECYTTLRSGSEGKVIVFGRPACGRTRATLQYLAADKRTAIYDVDIVFADVDGADKATVSTFEKEIGCSNITFCYGAECRTANRSYARHIPSDSLTNGSYSLPLVAYINGDNKLWALTTGTRSADQVYEMLYMDRPAPNPDAKKARFIDGLYATILGRPADAAGKAKYVEQLKGGKPAIDIAMSFIKSDEFKNKKLSDEDYVRVMYRIFLGREAADSEAAKWAAQIKNGYSREYVIRGVALSSEFTDICASYGIVRGDMAKLNRDLNLNVTNFVNRLYVEALGRSADMAGLEKHTGNIANKVRTPAQTAHDFVFSAEFRSKYASDEAFVEQLYPTLFGRKADAAGKAGWLKKMSGGLTREQVFNGFIGSDECKRLFASFGI